MPSSPIRLAAAVFAGGAIGALGRSALSVSADLSPWMTLATNTLGCLLLGCLLGALERRSAPDWLVAGLGAGLLASFTSMSAIAADTWLLGSNDPLSPALYLLLTVSAGLAAARAGFGLGRRTPRSAEASQ